VRQINDSVRYAPASARYKVYSSTKSTCCRTPRRFNAFLKRWRSRRSTPIRIRDHRNPQSAGHGAVAAASVSTYAVSRPNVLMRHLANIASERNVEVEPEALGSSPAPRKARCASSLSLFDQAIAHAAARCAPMRLRQSSALRTVPG